MKYKNTMAITGYFDILMTLGVVEKVEGLYSVHRSPRDAVVQYYNSVVEQFIKISSDGPVRPLLRKGCNLATPCKRAIWGTSR